MADRLGQQLGNYRLTRLLGRGGFAEVYLGEHLRLRMQAAIKVLYTQLEKDGVDEFLNEARTIAHLIHPHIIRIFDFDVQDGIPFLVMDYATNGTLRQRHPKGKPLPLATIVDYVKQVADALRYAHDGNLIHRDIKPENMLVGRRNEILLSDFGIALVAQSSSLQSTQEVAGTAYYMAPEQLQGKPRRASDQYSLGIVTYEWLCGSRPFHGSFSEIASQHMFVPPPPLHEKVPDIPSEVEEVVMIALDKDPYKRFSSVRTFAHALEQASQSSRPSLSINLSGQPLASGPTTPAGSPPAEFNLATPFSLPAASITPPSLPSASVTPPSQPTLNSPIITPPSLPPITRGNVTEAQKPSQSRIFMQRHWRSLLHVCMVLLMGLILFWGISPELPEFPHTSSDVTRYQCYAVVFWKGTSGLDSLPKSQCTFLESSSSPLLSEEVPPQGLGGNQVCPECPSSPTPPIQQTPLQTFSNGLFGRVELSSASQPLHILPLEYPFLSVLLFTLGYVASAPWYQIAFALWMALVAGVIYFVLKRYRSTQAAIAFALYLVIGSWATAEGRFDLVPSALTLGAVILARQSRWKWAFSLLALATLLKFYPVLLFIPFLITQQKQFNNKWNSWQRWNAFAVFIGICTLVSLVSLVLSVAGTLNPLRYFVNRPIQVESFPGSLLWLAHFVGSSVSYDISYQSLNFLSPLSLPITVLSTLFLVGVLLYIWWLQWHGRLDIYRACLLTLLVVLITGKVFSPQYLIWVTPLVAYIGKCNWKWLLSWGSVGLLTTYIFPYMYRNIAYIQEYYPVIIMRNVLILAMICTLLYQATRLQYQANPSTL